MGWSEWVQDPPAQLLPDVVKEYEDLPPGTSGSSVFSVSTSQNADAQVAWSTYQGLTTFANRAGILCTPPATWTTYRDWWPEALWPLTEGVDFDIIPGKTAADDDAYVEYEVTANAIAGWSMGTITALWENPHAATLTVPGSLMTVELVTGLPAVAPGSAPAFPASGSGTVLATYTTHMTSSATLTPGDPGAVSSVGLFTYDPNYSATPPTGADVYSVRGIAGWGTGFNRPWVKVTMPRYRYWIPGVIPNQWMQRRDGLGRGGVPLARGQATRQTSNQARVTY